MLRHILELYLMYPSSISCVYVCWFLSILRSYRAKEKFSVTTQHRVFTFHRAKFSHNHRANYKPSRFYNIRELGFISQDKPPFALISWYASSVMCIVRKLKISISADTLPAFAGYKSNVSKPSYVISSNPIYKLHNYFYKYLISDRSLRSCVK